MNEHKWFKAHLTNSTKYNKYITKTGAVVQKKVLTELMYASRLIVLSSFNRTAFTLSWNDTSHACNFNTCKLHKNQPYH